MFCTHKVLLQCIFISCFIIYVFFAFGFFFITFFLLKKKLPFAIKAFIYYLKICFFLGKAIQHYIQSPRIYMIMCYKHIIKCFLFLHSIFFFLIFFFLFKNMRECFVCFETPLHTTSISSAIKYCFFLLFFLFYFVFFPFFFFFN